MRGSVVLVLVALFGCGPTTRNNNNTDGTGPECESDGAHRCVGSTYQVCTDKMWATQEDCAVTCVEGIGCAQCQPGMGVCKDGNVHSCDASGNVGGQTEACTGSNICDGGVCVNACDTAAMNKSYTGCEYWAADLDNAVEVMGVQGSASCAAPGIKNVTLQACGNAGNTAVAGTCDPPGNTCPTNFTCKSMNVCILEAQTAPFAVVVSNPQSRAVNVTVTAASGATFTQMIAAGQVAALMPQAAPHSIPDQSLDGTSKENKAYKLVSDLPIVAYQFNPLDNVNVFSNDASLLIPRTAYDSEYYVMSWPTLSRRTPTGGKNDYHGYLSIVAWEDNTVIEVTPKAAVRASATQPAIAANTPTQFTLAKHDVLTLQAAPPMGDLTGTKVRAVNGTTTFGVFGGHEATGFGEMTPPNNTNIAGPCCADHLEDMMFPTSTWGKEFAIARSQSRGTKELDVLRIMAQKPNTTITFTPAPTGTCPTLNAGQHCEVKISVDTAISASEPVLIGHYLQSAIWQDPIFGGALGSGDPSMAIAVPIEQYRKDYTVLVPSQYTKNYMSISAPATGAVLVDGLPIALTAFGNHRAARHQVNPGQHKISCPNGCGLLVYGYSDAVSYMFAGGLDLKKIVIN
ncbi:MAG: IgGFc-binding protein [Myxococcota bacterium]|nr:IgGFc-binding protein [Deltaproteobacteria bacterium]MDQ3333782.1 IgGFc-binding protein [Myxococcota bacterium]